MFMLLSMCRLLLLPRLLPFLLLSRVSYGAEKHIKSVNDFITFSNDVNRGTTYSGTTILLDNDIDFAGKTAMEPIGKYGSFPFLGSFDGQGHVIRNLKMNVLSSEFGGLFGYSEGSSITNLVLDSSCSITSSSANTNSYTGSIIGYIKSDGVFSTIENIVNMASVTFSGDITNDLHFGGIVGVAWSTNYDIVIKKCLNYGTVTYNGTVNGYCDIGGIVGHFIEGTKYLQNCVNYGAITLTGSTNGGKCIGGISGLVVLSGENSETIVENCLSVGKIELNNNTNSFVGGIIGNINAFSPVNVIHCFWTNDTGCGDVYGRNEPNVIVVSDSHITELNTTTMNEMNDYAANKGWGKMTTFHLNGGRINNLTQDILVMAKWHFPDPVKEGNTFLFWCEDIYCNVEYNTSTPSNVSEVYAIWSASTLTFDFGNGTVLRKEFQFNETIEYPEYVTREGYTFSGWSSNLTKMPGADLTITARWVEIPVISSSSIEPSSSSSSIESKSTPSAITLVEIVFGKKGLTREEIEEIIKPFIDNNEFYIEEIKNDDENGTTVVVKFVDREVAEYLVNNLGSSSVASVYMIKRVGIVEGSSFSLLCHPLMLLNILIL